MKSWRIHDYADWGFMSILAEGVFCAILIPLITPLSDVSNKEIDFLVYIFF
jgi:hypothetical protein